jgi:hypothetical protein
MLAPWSGEPKVSLVYGGFGKSGIKMGSSRISTTKAQRVAVAGARSHVTVRIESARGRKHTDGVLMGN